VFNLSLDDEDDGSGKAIAGMLTDGRLGMRCTCNRLQSGRCLCLSH
jgi:hypothetical protein